MGDYYSKWQQQQTKYWKNSTPREDLPANFALRPQSVTKYKNTKIQKDKNTIKKRNKSCAVEDLLMATVASGRQQQQESPNEASIAINLNFNAIGQTAAIKKALTLWPPKAEIENLRVISKYNSRLAFIKSQNIVSLKGQ